MAKEVLENEVKETEAVKLVKVKHKVTGQVFTVASDSIYAQSSSYEKV